MNLKLYAVKKGNQKLDRNVQLVVVDLDKGKRYPLNFVCILPRYLRLFRKTIQQLRQHIRRKKPMRRKRPPSRSQTC